MRDCPSKHVMVVKDDGEYSSASDFDEDTLALLAADHAVVRNNQKSRLVQRMQIIMRASLCSVCLAHKWRRRGKINGIHCSKQSVSLKSVRAI